MTNWNPLYITLIALFVLIDVAAGAFYLGMRYAAPTLGDSGGELIDGTFISTGGIIQARSADSISLMTDQGVLRNFQLTPDTDIQVQIEKKYEWRNIKVGSRAFLMATNGVVETLEVFQEESSATTSLQQL